MATEESRFASTLFKSANEPAAGIKNVRRTALFLWQQLETAITKKRKKCENRRYTHKKS